MPEGFPAREGWIRIPPPRCISYAEAPQGGGTPERDGKAGRKCEDEGRWEGGSDVLLWKKNAPAPGDSRRVGADS